MLLGYNRGENVLRMCFKLLLRSFDSICQCSDPVTSCNFSPRDVIIRGFVFEVRM